MGWAGARMQAINQHASQRRGLIALGELARGEIDNGGKRGGITAFARKHRDQGRREGACHSRVQAGGDLQPGIGDQPLNHHGIAAGAGDLHSRDEILRQGIKVSSTHARLGHREGHRVRHIEVQQRPGEIGV